MKMPVFPGKINNTYLSDIDKKEIKKLLSKKLVIKRVYHHDKNPLSTEPANR